ncbi:MAG: hypothetical protein H7256_14040 [Bdellovibrio sp.]|nr:hypothetical protein [Bdellovibrio sp.]
MQRYKQPILTIFVIFATAYVLTLLGCAPASGSDAKATPATETPPSTAVTPETGDQNNSSLDLVEVDPNQMRECTTDEFSNLVSFSNSLDAAKEAIRISDGQKQNDTVRLALDAMKKCDQAQAYHTINPCKKMRRTIIDPDQAVLESAYDGSRIHVRCATVEIYLNNFDLRDANDAGQAPGRDDSAPLTTQPFPFPGEGDALRECSNEEFSKLNLWRSTLEFANRNIDKLGVPSAWKYEPNANDSAKAATASCEAEIVYHEQQPCRRTISNAMTGEDEVKIYSGSSLRNQCEKARMYNYDFSQQATSLIVPNVRLLLDTRIIANVEIVPGLNPEHSVGKCSVSNLSQNSVIYRGEKTLVTEAHVYPNPEDENFQKFVLVTAEGVKLECTDLEYMSLKTSKNEVVRLLNQKNTIMGLSYELN